MANVEKLSIALTPDMAGLVRSAVESGEYPTNSEVVRGALRERKQRRALQPRAIEEPRLLWEEGLASGLGASRTWTRSRRRPVAVGASVSALVRKRPGIVPVVRRTARAEDDLVDIWLYVAQDNPAPRTLSLRIWTAGASCLPTTPTSVAPARTRPGPPLLAGRQVPDPLPAVARRHQCGSRRARRPPARQPDDVIPSPAARQPHERRPRR